MISRVEDISFIVDGNRVGSVESRLIRVNRLTEGVGKLKEVTEEFEAIFVNLMLKSMRKSIGESGFLKGYREDIFKDFLYWEYSKLIAKNTYFGISEKIVELYKQNC